RQRIVGNMEAAPAHHAFKIDVKHQSNGPQSDAYDVGGACADLVNRNMSNSATCTIAALKRSWR
ncbi:MULTISPECIES: hypothetical protein, partial [unclassified Bradyrhizobium]|uniref:hypothetical protein n=1 Tax=unclassified Bradyrhizobium TaxID=2631580 RepID=UPI001FFBF8C0